jgi:hypothetical protein
MGKRVANRWWRRGYTSKELWAAAVAFVCLSGVNLVLHLTVRPRETWWIISGGMLIIAGVWAWRAYALSRHEKAQAHSSDASVDRA